MAHTEHKSHTALIWKVFGILSLITIVEVVLGIIKPPFLHLTSFLGTSPLNILFIVLTIGIKIIQPNQPSYILHAMEIHKCYS